jgi:zinc transporter ZupT
MAGTIGATLSYALTSPDYTCQLHSHEHVSMLTGDVNTHHHSGATSFALPFTIGGFLYISLVGIVPEIVEETDRNISLLQLFSFISGVIFIYFLVEIENSLPSLIT